jgi:hypothetical protein
MADPCSALSRAQSRAPRLIGCAPKGSRLSAFLHLKSGLLGASFAQIQDRQVSSLKFNVPHTRVHFQECYSEPS